MSQDKSRRKVKLNCVTNVELLDCWRVKSGAGWWCVLGEESLEAPSGANLVLSVGRSGCRLKLKTDGWYGVSFMHTDIHSLAPFHTKLCRYTGHVIIDESAVANSSRPRNATRYTQSIFT